MPIRLYSLAMDATDGRLEEHDGRWRLRFERRLAHPPERVWRAITEPDDLRAWFPFDIEGDRAAGAPLRFVFRDGEAEPFEGRMVAFDAPRALELEWGGGGRLRLEGRAGGGGRAPAPRGPARRRRQPAHAAQHVRRARQGGARRRRLARVPRRPRRAPRRRRRARGAGGALGAAAGRLPGAVRPGGVDDRPAR